MVRILISLLGVVIAWPAVGAVYQCVDASGRLLLTDSPCPAGYQSNLVVNEPPARAPSADEAARRHAEAQRDSAAAEAAALRQQLDEQKSREQAQGQRLQALDDKLDAVLEQQNQNPSLTVVGPPLWTAPRALPPCDDRGRGVRARPWVDCRPHAGTAPAGRHSTGKGGVGETPFARPPSGPTKAQAQAAKQRERDYRRECGIAGCTPIITHAPGDDARRARVP